MHRLDLPLQVKLERVLPIIVRLSGGGDSIVRRIHGDEMRRYRAGLPPSPQKNLQRTQSLYGCGGGVSAAKSGKVAAMTSLQRALGAISMSALVTSGHRVVKFRRPLLPRLCCKSRKLQVYEFFAKTRNGKQSPIRITSIALPKSPVSLTRGDEVPHIFTRKPRL